MAGTDLKPVLTNVLPEANPVPIGVSAKLPTPTRAYNISEGNRAATGIIPLPAPNTDESGFTKMVSSQDLFENRQYDAFDPEKSPDFYAYGQSTTDKAINGIAKFAGTAASTLVNNTAGFLTGLVSVAATRKLSSFYDNPFFKSMDDLDQEMRIRFPHLYTQAEMEDPLSANAIFSGNFLWDKIVSNLGYAAGAAITGYAAGGALEALNLSKGLVAAGKGLQALEATETAVAEGRSISTMLNNLRNASTKPLTKFGGVLEGFGTVPAGAKFSQASQLAGAFLSSTGESGMEAYQAKKQTFEKGVQLFKEAHGGQEPQGDDLKQIKDAAESAGNWTFGSNLALLTITENLQLPKIFGSSYTGEKTALNNLMFDGSTWKSALPSSRFGKLAYKGYKGASLFFNTAEAFEEGAQFAIEQGTNNYFNRKNRSKDDAWYDDLVGLITPGGQGIMGYGVKEALTSNEGIENILIGGLSGALMTGRGKVQQRGFLGYGGQEEALRQAAAKDWNNVPFVAKLKELKEFADISQVTQQQREDALRVGDILEAKDLEADYMMGYLMPRIKYGAKGAVDEEINNVRQQALTTEGFIALQEKDYASKTDTKESFLQRLDNIQATANSVQENYSKYSAKYAGEVLLDKQGAPVLDEKGNPVMKYSPEVINKLVYSTAKINDYDSRIAKLSSTLTPYRVSIVDILEGIDNNASAEELTKTIDIEADKIISSSKSDIVKTDAVTALQDIVEMGMRKKMFVDQQNEMVNNPENYTTKEEQPGAPKETIKVKTKNGEEDLEIGTEYFVGKKIKNAKGKITHQFTNFSIVGKNEDGSVKVKTEDGNTVDVAEADLSKMMPFVEKVSRLESDRKYKYWKEHADTIFTFNFGKNRGGEQRGRLQFSPKEGILEFVYLDEKGKQRIKEVSSDQFVAKEGYKNALITAVGKLTPVQQSVLNDYTSKPDDRQFKKIAARAQTVNELFEESSNNLDNTKKLIADKTQQLEKVQEELKAAQEKMDKPEYTKAGKFKAITKNAIKAVKRLSKLQDDLTMEIQSLENEQKQLEINMEYLLDLYGDIALYPSNSTEFYNELKKERDVLESLVNQTRGDLSALRSLLTDVNDALEVAVEFVRDLIDKFATKYPDLPFGQNELRDFLNSNLEATKAAKEVTPTSEGEKILPYTAISAGLLDDLSTFDREIADLDDIEIVPREQQIDEINAEISKTLDKLFELKKQLAAKDQLLERLKQIADDYNRKQAEEKKLLRNEKLATQVIGTLDTGTPTAKVDTSYKENPKKNILQVVLSTTSPSTKTAGGQLKAHQIRANKFGATIDYDYQVNNLRAVVVNQQTAAQLGLPDLMTYLKGDSDVDPKFTLAVVIVDKNGKVVGVDGKALDNPTVETAIYQTMPTTEKLKDLFRDDVPSDTKAALEIEYKQWRTAQLESTVLEPTDFDISFGSPQRVQTLSEDGKTKETDYSATTPLTQTGLISDSDLSEKQVLRVAVEDAPLEKGSTSFKNPLGRTFLRLRNAYVNLNNRLLNKKEASAIYDAIYRLSVNMLDNGTVKNEEGDELISWLRSIIYWGKPQEKAGYSNVWFDRVNVPGTPFNELRLFMSGKGESFKFTPTDLEANKEELIMLLQKMYNNINAKRVNDSQTYLAPYKEITAVSKDGVITSKEWPNYQTYLLSSEGRESQDIPLTTNMRPLNGPEDVNREGIYFTLVGNKEAFENVINKSQKPAFQPVPFTPAQTTEQAPVAQTRKPSVFATSEQLSSLKYDNTTINTITVNDPSGNKIGDFQFIVDNEGEPSLVESEENSRIISAFATANNRSEDIAENSIGSAIVKTLEKFENGDIVAAPAVTVQPIQPAIVAEAEDVADDQMSDEDKARMAEKVARIQQNGSNNEILRAIVDNQLKSFKPENWNDVENWLKSKFPNIPVYRVQNIITSTNGRQGWGMFKDGAIYIYTNAEVGTVYHEVFHAVWRMFSTTEERNAIIKEFKNRKGSFEDRESGRVIEYSKATNEEIEEKIAEEFRDYVQSGKTETKSGLAKLFSDLVNFIKEFFLGESADKHTSELFAKIGNGYYAQVMPYSASLSYAQEGLIDIDYVAAADEDALRPIFSPSEVNDIVQHMLYRTVANLVEKNDSLSKAMGGLKKSRLYAELREEIEDRLLMSVVAAQQGEKDNNITAAKSKDMQAKAFGLANAVAKNNDLWNNIINRYEEKIKAYDISFDENDNVQLTSEERSGKETWADANKIDLFKKANGTIKLLLSSVPYPDVNKPGEYRLSTINGATLVPASEIRVSILNKVHSATTIDEMMESLRQMAVADPKFAPIYKRLTKNTDINTEGDLSNLKTMADVMLVNAFWKTFKTQNPVVKNLFVLENGDVVVGDSNFTTAARDIRNDYISDVRTLFRGANDYVQYDEAQKAYVAKPVTPATKKLNGINDQIELLKSLDIVFNKKQLEALFRKSPTDKDNFDRAVANIRTDLNKIKKISAISGRTLDIDNRLLELAEIQAKIDNPEFSSTFFNVNGERTQVFIGTNPISNLQDVLSKITNLSQLEGTQYEYLMTDRDSFTQHSVIIDQMFNRKTGNKREGAEQLFKVAYADGVVNSVTGKNKQSSKLSFMQRLTQEMNMNLKGFYMNLVPGDASMEHMVYMGKPIKYNEKDIQLSTEGIYGQFKKIFKGYFIDELELSREGRRIVQNKSKTRNTSDMRFFKDILGDDLHREVVESSLELSTEEVFKANEEKINLAIDKFLEKETNKFRALLEKYGLLYMSRSEEGVDENTYALMNVDVPDNGNLTNTYVTKELTGLTANYMIANIELHKLIYSDPYQYKDELKRIKNFNSPRQEIIHGSADLNSVMNKVWNEGYEKGDIGHTDFNAEQFRTITLADVKAINELADYSDSWDEADGGGIIAFKAHRNFRIRSGEWNDLEEKQYRYDIAYEKRDKGIALSEIETKLLSEPNPQVKSTYTPVKPIVAGNKGNGKNYNDVMLDKFALYPLSYRIAKEINEAALEAKESSNLLNQYNKMQKENIDYAIFDSGRKVGAEDLNELYDAKGAFNNAPYKGIINVPFSIMSVQSEVPSKDSSLITRGSQVTKLITLDFMQAGVPVDYKPDVKDFNQRFIDWNNEEDKEGKSKLYKEIKTNQKLLEEIMDNGYAELLDLLGITETREGFVIDPDKIADTLKSEILKREVNDNIVAALSGFTKGQVVLEATPAYQQIRNILYSIADSNVISPKMSGGMKVQIPSTLLEEVRQEKKNGAYTSDVLDFYEKDGKRVCEIMVGRWFKSDKTDKELLDSWYDTDADGKKTLTAEGEKVLSGLGFRIPTQKQNSIDSFVIKQFLPKEFGDSVVIPSALVKKAGSDFDIDKLNIYLKNVYTVASGDVKVIPFIGYGQEAKDKFEALIDSGEFLNKEELKELDRFIEEERDELFSKQYDEEGVLIDLPENKLFRTIFANLFSEDQLTKDFIGLITKRGAKKALVNELYKKSLQNAYIESSQNLVSSEENFDQLVKPNSADQLQKLAIEINRLKNKKEIDYSATENMLDRGFMNRLRQDFVSGKYAIGIAAVAQTNHSLNQRQPIYIDINRLKNVPLEDSFWLRDGKFTFSKYNKIEDNGEIHPSLSGIKNAAGDYISDILGQFIDGYVDIAKGPWIMDLGATPDVAGTYLFLVKAGVPINTVAYFMNQPIIREYLNRLEVANKSWLFNASELKSFLLDYSVDQNDVDEMVGIPSDSILKEYIGKDSQKLSRKGQVDQVYMLLEFLKYAKMANQLYTVTQGTNYDTAAFNDPYLVFKKEVQYEMAKKTIISSPEKLLESSFLGKLRQKITDVREVMSNVLLSDKGQVRNVMQAVLLPYVNTNDRDFVKIAQKAVSDLFDYAIQTATTDTGSSWNKQIYRVLVDNNKNVAKHVLKFKKETRNPSHPLFNNDVMKLIVADDSSGKHLAVKNLKISNSGNQVYDQNQLIYSFHELKNYLYSIDNISGITGKDFYKNLVALAVLQSGLSTSNISFTSLLPYDDFVSVYNNVISTIDTFEGLNNFYNLRVFNRENWSDSTYTPYVRARLFKGRSGKWFYNMNMQFFGANADIQTAIDKGQIPQLLNIGVNTEGSNSDVIVYSWEDKLHKNYKIDKELKRNMRREGDYSYMKKALFKKIYNGGEPLVYNNYANRYSYVYKMINAWGMGKHANEFYNTARPSVIDNGFVKVQEGKGKRVDKFKGSLDVTNANEMEDTPILDTLLPILGDRVSMNSLMTATPIDLFGDEFAEEPAAPAKEQTENWQEEDNTCTNPIG